MSRRSDIDKQLSVLSKRLKAARAQTEEAARRAILAATEEAMAQSIRRAPIDTGALVSDHQAEVVVDAAGNIAGRLYIAPNAESKDYALKVHEHLPGLGPRSRAKQEADPSVVVGDHFMQRAFDEEQDRYERIITGVLKAELKKPLDERAASKRGPRRTELQGGKPGVFRRIWNWLRGR